MSTNTLSRLLMGTALMMASSLALSTPPLAAQDDEARAQQPENYCLGGIEHRKLIVDESQITNPFRQTSRLGCEVDGGDPQTMPDLPTPSAEPRRVV